MTTPIQEEAFKEYGTFKDLKQAKHGPNSPSPKEAFLAGAKWMAEYILNNTDAGLDTNFCCVRLKDGSHLPRCGGIVTDEIRQLAKELNEEGV